MKKFFVMLSIMTMSIFAFADGTSCSIRGSEGTITIQNENGQSDSNGKVCVYLSIPGLEMVNVIVKCYDAYTDECIDVRSFRGNRMQNQVCFTNLKKDHAYYFRLSDAHCG